jgi:predicted transcriptional regulator
MLLHEGRSWMLLAGLILWFINKKKPTKTAIRNYAGTSYKNLMKNYLSDFEDRKLIKRTERGDRTIYILTDRGLRFSDVMDEIITRLYGFDELEKRKMPKDYLNFLQTKS